MSLAMRRGFGLYSVVVELSVHFHCPLNSDPLHSGRHRSLLLPGWSTGQTLFVHRGFRRRTAGQTGDERAKHSPAAKLSRKWTNLVISTPKENRFLIMKIKLNSINQSLLVHLLENYLSLSLCALSFSFSFEWNLGAHNSTDEEQFFWEKGKNRTRLFQSKFRNCCWP